MYLIRVIDNDDVTHFMSLTPQKDGEFVHPSKSHAYYTPHLREAIVHRDRLRKSHKAAWIVFGEPDDAAAVLNYDDLGRLPN